MKIPEAAVRSALDKLPAESHPLLAWLVSGRLVIPAGKGRAA